MKTLLILLLLTLPCYAGQMTVQTGYGYLVKDGHITDKMQLPQGSHPLKDGYTYVEVNSQAELDAVQVYVAPSTAEEVAKQKADKERQDALDELIQERIAQKKAK